MFPLEFCLVMLTCYTYMVGSGQYCTNSLCGAEGKERAGIAHHRT